MLGPLSILWLKDAGITDGVIIFYDKKKQQINTDGTSYYSQLQS